MQWKAYWEIWRVLRVYFVAFFTGIAVTLYGLLRDSWLWSVLGVILLLYVSYEFRQHWKELKWELRDAMKR